MTLQRLVPVLAVLLASACSPWTEDTEAGLHHLTDTRASRSAGRITARVPVTEGETGMLFTIDPASPHRAVFQELVAPDGSAVYDLDVEWDSGRLKTGARYSSNVNSLNWPVIPGDRPLEPGTWRVRMGVVDVESQYVGGVSADLDVVLKADSSFDGGSLDIDLVFAGAAADDAELDRAVGEALDVWADLYALASIELEISERTWPDDALGLPGQGTAEAYEAISAEAPLEAVTVVIVPVIEGSPNIYGVSGGIPGPLVGSARSVVVVSGLTHSGNDLVFDSEEERLLGETLAHETLHFLGLFHPVEPSWDTWDALDDTPECGRQTVCVDELGDNLMFPYPVCTDSGCRPQDQLTDAQGGTANRYTGVR